MTKVKANNIAPGVFIWYSGRISMGRWDCPAVITRVNTASRIFYIKSLDDMLEQAQSYSYDETVRSPASRINMRLATAEEVGVYLDKQEERLVKHVAMTRRVHNESSLTLHRFREEREKLFPGYLKK